MTERTPLQEAMEALGRCIDVADGYARQERSLPQVPATMEYQVAHIREAYRLVCDLLSNHLKGEDDG